MNKIANKAVPLACIIAAPFCLSAGEQSNAALCAAPKPIFSSPKVATTHNNNSYSSSNQKTQQYITPPAGPLVSNGADVYLTADFIYWKPTVTGLDFAFSGGVSGGGFTSQVNAIKGKVYSPDFEYRPGFKVALGVLSEHDNWDIATEYTWLKVDRSDTKKRATGDNTATGFLQGTHPWGHLGMSPVYTEVVGQWGLEFNVLDVELGRKFWLSKRLSMRPHVGMKFSWIEQKYDILGSGLIENGVQTTHSLDYRFELEQFGVGFRTGMDTNYYMWNKWSIFGDWAITGLLNYFDSKRKDLFRTAPGAEEFTNLNTHWKPRDVSLVLELALGLRFETIFSDGRYMYMLQAGWESQVWFDQSNFIKLQSEDPQNLTMQGLTIKTGFWF